MPVRDRCPSVRDATDRFLVASFKTVPQSPSREVGRTVDKEVGKTAVAESCYSHEPTVGFGEPKTQRRFVPEDRTWRRCEVLANCQRELTDPRLITGIAHGIPPCVVTLTKYRRAVAGRSPRAGNVS